MTDVVIVLIGRARHTYILYLLLYDTCGGSSTFFFWLRIAISYECTIISCSYRLVLREAFSKLLNKLYSYRLHSETFQIGVSNYHIISPDSKQSPSREILPTNNNRRVLARMWKGYNKSSRPIWLEFRSSKWLIGWTAAVAAFTVGGFYSTFFVRLNLGGQIC